MRNKQGITAFYMEMLVLILVFIGVILMLTRMFALSKEQSSQAQVLTRAVCLAENAAELLSGADSAEELYLFLDENGNAEKFDNGTLRARYDLDMTPSSSGEFWVDMTWDEQDGLVTSEIAVYWWGEEDPVYTLRTAAYGGGGAS